MDFTNPFVGIERRKLTDQELAQAIRLDMAAELDAINLYQSHLESTDNPLAKRIIGLIMQEEKEHLEEFTQLLLVLDPGQQEAIGHARGEVAELGLTPPEIPVPPDEAREAAPVSSTLTVGSLRDAG